MTHLRDLLGLEHEEGGEHGGVDHHEQQEDDDARPLELHVGTLALQGSKHTLARSRALLDSPELRGRAARAQAPQHTHLGAEQQLDELLQALAPLVLVDGAAGLVELLCGQSLTGPAR